ncbi:MAG TPA: 3-hydroxyacyl-CoA dehydrogenase family protein [Bacteroidota bacterium]|nr:3-hydroxyacyl-CoA dehydrogenase family protein [Bacteroidota bacterium]
MNILFTGSPRLLGDWLTVCREHTCIVYGKGIKKQLPDHVVKIHALDEAPEVDLIIDLHIRDSKKWRLILSDLLAEIATDVPMICNTIAVTSTEIGAITGSPERIIGIAALPTLVQSGVVEVSYPYGHPHAHDDVLRKFFDSIGKRMVVVRDEIGMVTPRILAVMINEAMLIMQQDIAGEDDIEAALAVALGTEGPISWARRFGWENVYNLLYAMYDELGGERYRPASLLRKMALTD